jgi:ribosomal protein S18 acetylase RimI-like enzyme
MDITIRSFQTKDTPDLVYITLQAFEPIFQSFRQILGPHIYNRLYPDWRQIQQSGIESICQDVESTPLLVAEQNGVPVGYLAYTLNPKDKTGEIQLLAVHPDIQNQGVGTALNLAALERMKAAGMKLAVVGTGGDPSHAPARKSYENAGFIPLPLVRYYQDL